MLTPSLKHNQKYIKNWPIVQSRSNQFKKPAVLSFQEFGYRDFFDIDMMLDAFNVKKKGSIRVARVDGEYHQEDQLLTPISRYNYHNYIHNNFESSDAVRLSMLNANEVLPSLARHVERFSNDFKLEKSKPVYAVNTELVLEQRKEERTKIYQTIGDKFIFNIIGEQTVYLWPAHIYEHQMLSQNDQTVKQFLNEGRYYEVGAECVHLDVNEVLFLPEGYYCTSKPIGSYLSLYFDISLFGLQAGKAWVLDCLNEEVSLVLGSLTYYFDAYENSRYGQLDYKSSINPNIILNLKDQLALGVGVKGGESDFEARNPCSQMLGCMLSKNLDVDFDVVYCLLDQSVLVCIKGMCRQYLNGQLVSAFLDALIENETVLFEEKYKLNDIVLLVKWLIEQGFILTNIHAKLAV